MASNIDNIELLLESLVQYPDAVPAILDNITNPGLITTLNSAWNLGATNLSTAIYRGTLLWRNAGKEPVKTLLEDGLLEVLAALAQTNPEKFKEIISKVADHPIVGPYKDLIKDLNDPAFLQECLSNKEAIFNAYEAITYYQSLDKQDDSLDIAFQSVVSPIINLAASESVRGHLKKLATPELIEHIHELDGLKDFTNSKKLFANLAKNSKEFQNVVETILAQDTNSLNKITSAVLEYTSLPENPNKEPELTKIATEKWKVMLSSFVELAANEQIRGKLKELGTGQLIEDIYNLDALTRNSELDNIQNRLLKVRQKIELRDILQSNPEDKQLIQEELISLNKELAQLTKEQAALENAIKNGPQASKKLVKDLVMENPEGFKALVEEILASKLVPQVTDKLLTYLSSSAEDIQKNPAIWNDFLSSIVELSAQKDVIEKIAPLLSDKLVDNLLQYPGLETYENAAPLLKAITKTIEPSEIKSLLTGDTTKKITLAIELLNKKDTLETLTSEDTIKLISSFLPKNDTIPERAGEAILKAAEEIIEDGRENKDINEETAQGLKASLQVVNASIDSKKETSKTDYTNQSALLRNLAADVKFLESAKDLSGKQRIAEMLQSIIDNNPNNNYIKEVNKWGIKGKDLTELSKKLCTKENLTAVADCLDGKIGVATLVAKTQTRTFVIKHLVNRVGNYIKDMMVGHIIPKNLSDNTVTLDATPTIGKPETLKAK